MIEAELKRLSSLFLTCSLVKHRSGLFLRASVPGLSGTSKNVQKRINLYLKATPANLERAEDLARKLDRQLGRHAYVPADWTEEALTNTGGYESLPSMEDFCRGIEALFERKCSGVPKNSMTAWGKKYKPAIKLFSTIKGPCTEERLLSLIRSVAADSSRKSIASITRQTVIHLGYDFNRDKITEAGSGYVRGKVEPRDIPDDELIESVIETIEHPVWRYLYGICWLYGIRGHEIVGSTMEKRANGGWVLYVPDDSKTGYRECWACPGEKVEQYDLQVPYLPTQDKYSVTKAASDYLSKVKKSYKKGVRDRPARIPFSLYNLRHAYALRLLSRDISTIRSAKLMGHSLKEHEATYHRWITHKHMVQMHDQEAAHLY